MECSPYHGTMVSYKSKQVAQIDSQEICASSCLFCNCRYLSTRGHVWTDVDNSRTGGLHFVFDEGFGFEQYVDYAMGVPMYFVYRYGFPS